MSSLRRIYLTCHCVFDFPSEDELLKWIDKHPRVDRKCTACGMVSNTNDAAAEMARYLARSRWTSRLPPWSEAAKSSETATELLVRASVYVIKHKQYLDELHRGNFVNLRSGGESGYREVCQLLEEINQFLMPATSRTPQG